MAITRIGNPALANVREPNFRNIIINGGMDLAQRSTSVTGITASSYNTIDRFQTGASSAGTWTQSQSTDVPTGQGFATSLKMDCTTANTSLGSSARLQISQKIEGQNLQYLKKGTSDAVSTTLSFWVKSNKTGIYICELYDSDNTRHIAKSYTISSANTWEKKTLTYAGDTSGAFGNDNGDSLALYFWLVAGSTFNASGNLATSWASVSNSARASDQVNLADSTSNEWYVTGVQLEAGSVASDFEFLPVDVNLERCKRYYQLLNPLSDTSVISVAASYTTTTAYAVLSLNPEMRAQPSLDQVTGTDYFVYLNAGSSRTFDSFAMSTGYSINRYIRINNSDNLSTNTTAGQSGWFTTNNTSSFIGLDSEL